MHDTTNPGKKPPPKKQPWNKWKNPKVPRKKNTAAKFTKKNPGAYIPKEEWNKLTEEQKVAAREARNADGIPTRGLKALIRAPVPSTQPVVEPPTAMVVEELEEETPLPPAKAASAIVNRLLAAPKVRQLTTTQREATYAKAKAPGNNVTQLGNPKV